VKILIYGEYSGYGKSLATGFKSLGHEASVFSPNGDGWKKITSEFTLPSATNFGKLMDLIKLIPKFVQFEVVLITNPQFFNFKLLGPIILWLFKLKKLKLYLLCCGDDVEYIRAGESKKIKKFIFNGVEYPKNNYFKRLEDKFINYICANAALKIIPTMYDYQLPWSTSEFSGKLTEVIPLACDAKPVSEIKKINMESIKIMHGINRADVKGSSYILAALEQIEKEFENVVIYTPEKLPQNRYLELLSQVDISIDQCKCHSYGMNAIYAMLNGHIVMAPADEYHNKSFCINSSPIISIDANSDNIYLKIKNLICNYDLDGIKKDTLEYAKYFHSPLNVCKKILAHIE